MTGAERLPQPRNTMGCGQAELPVVGLCWGFHPAILHLHRELGQKEGATERGDRMGMGSHLGTPYWSFP